jgi:hypothetical protein
MRLGRVVGDRLSVVCALSLSCAETASAITRDAAGACDARVQREPRQLQRPLSCAATASATTRDVAMLAVRVFNASRASFSAR